MRAIRKISAAALVAAACGAGVQPASAAATFFFSDTPYLSEADIPHQFYFGDAPVLLDTLEDGSLDASLSASAGSVIGPGQFDGLRDSVDGDDGDIDGSGTAGRSWFTGDGTTGVTFTFNGVDLPTAFGLVWTDSGNEVVFSAKDGNGDSLGTITRSGFSDGVFTGATAEDRFFGVTFEGGIKSISISNFGAGIELDHIQYGIMFEPTPVPLPGAAWLMLSGAAALAVRRRRAG
ncbi:MAG: hypothetical protein AB7I01_08990 [Gammaproteobacteria bacterium]